MVAPTTHEVRSTGVFYKGITLDMRSPQRTADALTYTPGTTVVADGLDEDPGTDCGAGINFSRTVAEALRWGPMVVELRVPASECIIDTGRKLRARRVEVVKKVDLAHANLASAYLAGANLAGAYLGGAYLAHANLADANLASANLADANLASAYLARANLVGAYLVGAYLARANLAHANLAHANLARAYLAGAYLASANLAGAYLAGANGKPATGMPSGWALTDSQRWCRA